MKKMNMRVPYCPAFMLAAFVLTVTGCRDYGEYNNQELLKAAMVETVGLFENERALIQRDLHRLELAVGADTTLRPFLEELQIISTAHEALRESHRELAAELADADWYRPVRRAYGAIVAEQEILRERYAMLLYDVTQTVDTTVLVPGGVLPRSRYTIVPPYYERTLSAVRLLELAGVVEPRASVDTDTATAPETVDADTAAAPAAQAPEPAEEEQPAIR